MIIVIDFAIKAFTRVMVCIPLNMKSFYKASLLHVSIQRTITVLFQNHSIEFDTCQKLKVAEQIRKIKFLKCSEIIFFLLL